MSEVFRGACLCEAVRFTLSPPTKFCAHCHCTMCRRAHGAPIVTWVGVLEAQLSIDEGSEVLVRHASSAEARRTFCSKCGSMLFFEGKRWPGEVHVARASIPGPIDRMPQAHVYFDVGVDWIKVDDHLPKLGGESGTQPI